MGQWQQSLSYNYDSNYDVVKCKHMLYVLHNKGALKFLANKCFK